MTEEQNDNIRLSKKDIVQLVYLKEMKQGHKTSKAQVKSITDNFLAEIEGAIAQGNNVNLYQFGTFKLKHLAQKKFSNFNNKTVVVKPRYSVKFQVGIPFRNMIDENYNQSNNKTTKGEE